MKKLLAFLTVAAMFAFTACNGGGDDTDNGGGEFTITATNIKKLQGESDDEVVKVAAIWWSEESETEEAHFTIATADYINHGFTITLPVPADNMLWQLGDAMEGLTVSDPTARYTRLYAFRGLNAADEPIQRFKYLSNDAEEHTVNAVYWYVDKDLNITGAYEYDDIFVYTYDMQLKKGWNVAYEYDGDNDHYLYFITTTLPAGYAMEWYYQGY